MFRPIVWQGHAVFADGGCPNRGGKVGIVFKAGDDVPMQMGDDVAQAGKVMKVTEVVLKTGGPS